MEVSIALMLRLFTIPTCILLLLITKHSVGIGANKQVVRGCYYELSMSLLPAELNATLCTHIYAAFATGAQGEISPSKDDDVMLYKKLMTVKSKHPSQLSILISVGGTLALASSTPENRTRFAKSCIAFCNKYGFDGVDLDWEFPRYEERRQFTLLLREIRRMINETHSITGRRLLLTAAVSASPWGIFDHYEVPGLDEYLDMVNIMTYDLHYFPRDVITGHHSPLYGRHSDLDPYRNTVGAVMLYLRLGLRKEKAVVGIPAYARSFLLRNASEHDIGSVAVDHGPHNWMTYVEICSVLASGGVQVDDAESRVPYVYKERLWFGYNDPKSVAEKCEWIKRVKVGGAFTWSLNMDNPHGQCPTHQPFPVHTAIYKALH